MNIKRYCVFLDDHIVAAFDNYKEATAYINDRWWLAIATIWDQKKRTSILTEIRI